MKICCRCAKCGTIFMQEEDDLMIQLDFREQTISFVCRNKKCNHDNIMDVSNWEQRMKRSPLPRMITM
jgi:hypothetical protein